ncbi:MAG: ribosomal protein S18-alanine N-acetyltransferase [Gammaproteobacteria bacterium]|nr:ribosomal protein S18-alanine N-acetyltransferase [Gammaproteobacteria bacterium]
MQARHMLESDIAEVTNIEQQANMFPWSRKHFESSLKAGHQAWVFCNDQNQILGFTIVQQILDETHLLNICVKPTVQGRGYGREILNYVIEFSNSISSNIILLEVRQTNLRAQQLYLNSGFNEIAVRKNYYPSDNGCEDAILMGIDLSLMSLFASE